MLSKSSSLAKFLRPDAWLRSEKSLRLTKVIDLSLSEKTRLSSYEELYENHAKENSTETVVGNGDFSKIGFLELSILKECGLEPEHRLMDLGCGSGRLARFAIPYLDKGHYLGVEISQSILEPVSYTHLTLPTILLV